MKREIKFLKWNKPDVKIRAGSKGWYSESGYIMQKVNYHPRMNKRGYVSEHRLLMENELNRYLEDGEIVHHIDENRSNNQLSNLKLVDINTHYNEHDKARNPNGSFIARDPIFLEIKYRLYDSDNKLTQIYTLQELIAKTYRRGKFEFRGRYTGLKDKNGKEIYEGDILQEDCPRSNKYKVFSVKGGFAINTHQDDIGRDTPFFDSIADMQNSSYLEGHCTIIGNIYESHELLK